MGSYPYSGCEQHVLVQSDGKVILFAARCCRRSLLSLSKRKTLNARWSKPLGWSGMNRCEAYLLSCPTMLSFSSCER